MRVRSAAGVLARRVLLRAKAGGGAELVNARCEHRALAAGVATEQEVVGIGARVHGDRQLTAHVGRHQAAQHYFGRPERASEPCRLSVQFMRGPTATPQLAEKAA